EAAPAGLLAERDEEKGESETVEQIFRRRLPGNVNAGEGGERQCGAEQERRAEERHRPAKQTHAHADEAFEKPAQAAPAARDEGSDEGGGEDAERVGAARLVRDQREEPRVPGEEKDENEKKRDRDRARF